MTIVNNPDRDAAVQIVASALSEDQGYSCPDFDEAAAVAVDVLIANGWGQNPSDTPPVGPCDYPGTPSMLNGRCRCLVCGRCGHHTGNSSQGHYWLYCHATKVTRKAHFCCPGNCELERSSSS